MAKVAGAGSVSMGSTVAGKRLGVKKFEGESVKAGNVLVKQRGSVYHPGKNTYISRDHTIHSKIDGIVKFRRMSGFKRGQFYIDVLESV
ncbi:MAG: 50S ribosomal protein L27 [Candidatus Dojkabacteria bacterium]|jgi:large subunit ribosomal protein L27